MSIHASVQLPARGSPVPALGRRGFVCPVEATSLKVGVRGLCSGGSSSSSCRFVKERTSGFVHLVRVGVGAGASFVVAGGRRKAARRVGQWDSDLIGLAGLNQGFEDEEPEPARVPASRPEEDEDDETWVFWEEQKHPTPGSWKKPRHKIAAPLPNPLPTLEPPPTVGEDGKALPSQGRTFEKAYGSDMSTIMDTDGAAIEVDEYYTFKEAVEELNLPPFLQAALERRKFYFLTPVQQCSLPLLRSGKDFLASAFTGSGKTAAYLIPILHSLYEVTRLVPGTKVASHFKTKRSERSAQPLIGTVRGVKNGQAAIEFELATGKAHRQLVPPDWVTGAPEPPVRRNFEGPVTPLALVLVPTRELSEQVHKEAKEFLHYSQMRSAAIHGNNKIRSQMRELAHGADILVATPGRLVDAMHKGLVKLHKVKYLVLDEVDRMMELGFGSQLEEIVQMGNMPSKGAGGRHTSFWSATIPMSVRDLVEGFLGSQCVWVDCTGGQTNPMPSTVSHVFIDARPPHRVLREFHPGDSVILKGGRKGTLEFPVGKRWRVMFEDGDLVERQMIKKGKIHLKSGRTEPALQDKLAQLKEILESQEFYEASVIIFCRRRDTVMEVFKYLRPHFEGVVTCHGGMSQTFRSRSVKAVREGTAEVLVATDIAARGLDMETVTHVINFELPLVIDEFVHRIGRTGRIGRKGTAITFVNGREKIFTVMRKMIRNQGHPIPKWLSLEGLSLAWRPRNYRMPFLKGRKGIAKDALMAERFAFLEKNRNIKLRTQTNLTKKMMAAEGRRLEPRAKDAQRRNIFAEIEEEDDDDDGDDDDDTSYTWEEDEEEDVLDVQASRIAA
eukprot:TRINITY_DN7770_c0_g1_i1.p1 TRINITY_DN7770_c0_g1~~TRINITY_DN7770_c0_g1_i1.p1  ORF type:complete len:840 (-),score=190.86 TRINITY_DN7770_c0_g1_i1:32-2551(-)